MDGLTLRRVIGLLAVIAFGARGDGCHHRDHRPAKTPAPTVAFSNCTLCHIDIQEKLANGGHGPAHLPAGHAGITCASCHGESRGHVTDEHNNVKPDRRFTRETAPGLCGECHPDQLTRPAAGGGPRDCLQCHDPHYILPGKTADKGNEGGGGGA